MHARDAGHCAQCGEQIDTKAPGNAQAVRGWRVNRRQGGANMIALAEVENRWLCRHCLDKRRAGVSWDQPSLFED